MLLNINYKTEYKIEGILNEGYQRVILIPKSSNSQKIIEWNLNIEGGIKEINSKDHFSNSVNLIRMNDDTNTINISVIGKVETINCNGVFNDYKDSLPIWSYTQQTKLTMPGKELKNFFKKVPFKNDNLIEYLHSLSNYIRDKIEYIPGTTNYKTTAEEAVKIRKGVCQDHTHIFLSLVRMDNLPCRYVSGFFLPEIKYQDLKGNFLAIIKNKKDEKYLLKNRGLTKEAAANNGIEKCKENFPNVLDLDNNGCYIHYQKKVTQF